MPTKTYTATGITLLARKSRASERVVSFYTREHGKVEAAAAGIGKPGSSLAGAVEPFTVSQLFLVRGRNLDRLTQARVLEAFPELAARLEAFGYATWLAELTARMTEPGEAAPELFDRLRESLRALAEGTEGALVAAAYGLALLEEQGLAPILDRCAACGRGLAGASWYDGAAGGLLCSECGGAGGPRIQISAGARGLMHGLRRLPANRLRMLRALPRESAEVLALLGQHLEYHLGFRLKSEEFLQQLRQQEYPG